MPELETYTREPETRLHRWYRKNAEWLALGIAFAVGAALVCDGFNAQKLDAAIGTFTSDENAYCSGARARLVTVENFWNDTAKFRQSHSNHEGGAATTWSDIVQDLDREKIGSAKLHADVSKVSNLWTQLAADDAGNADRARAYVRDIQADFDKRCGDVPTPTPVTLGEDAKPADALHRAH